MDDEQEANLLARVRAGDDAAFAELVREHQSAVYRLLLRLLGDPSEAEDVAQEVFVSVYRAASRFRGDSRLSTWLYRIATNHAKNRLKYLARRGSKDRGEYEDRIDPSRISNMTTSVVERPDRLVEGMQAQGLMERALSALDQDQRVLVILRDVEHMSYEDIQRVTGLPIGTVKSRLHRARLLFFQTYTELKGGAE